MTDIVERLRQGDIVEHVAKALCMRRLGVDPDLLPVHDMGWPEGEEWRNYAWSEDVEPARAAIRATLEYLRENVSAEMIERSLGWREYDIPDHWPDEARVPYGIFRAMLSAALNDIERTG